MRQAHLTAPRLDAIRIEQTDPPRPGPGEVLLRLKAASLNFRDVAIASGGYPVPTAWFPLVPLSDAVGEVVETGAGVEGWAAGERAVPHYMPDWTAGRITPAGRASQLGGPLPGVAREYMLARPHWLARPQAAFTDAEAATLPIAATTAWNALRAGDIGPGSEVLVLGTGGVALFSVQLAKAAGARVIVASSSAARLERARDLGADEGIDYSATPEWDVEVRRLTSGRGVDIVVEVGGEGTLARAMRAVAHGGTVSLIGFLAGAAPALPLVDALVKGVRLQGIATGSRADMEEAAAVLARHSLRPVIDRVVSLEELAPALAAMSAGGHFGKIVVGLA